MKRFLSLILSLAMVMTCCAWFASAEDDIVELHAVANLHTSTRDLDELPIFNEIAEKAGVHINWELYRADYDTKKQTILASGDLPDFFFGAPSLTENDIMLNSEYFIPLEDLIEEYCPNITRMFETYPITKEINTFNDGHIYALSHYMGGRPTIYGSSFINGAWLEKLGLDMPTTIDELTEVARHFATEDPNGNGIADELAIEFGSLFDNTFGARVLWGAFGIHDSLDSFLAIDDDGNVVYNPAVNGYKDWLIWLNQIYDENLVDREFLTHDFAQFKAKSRRSEEEITGIQFGWDIGQMGNPNYTMLMPLEGPNGDHYYSGSAIVNKLAGQGGTYCCMSITTACKNPEAVMKWADYFYTDEYGVQAFFGAYGEGLRLNEDNTIQRIWPEDQTADNWAWTVGVSATFIGWMSPDVDARLVNDDEWYRIGMGKLDFDAAYLPYVDESHNFPPVKLTVEETSEAASLYTDINNVKDTFAAKFVSEGGIEEGWDTYLAELENAGLSRYLEIYQNAYDLTH